MLYVGKLYLEVYTILDFKPADSTFLCNQTTTYSSDAVNYLDN